MEWLQLLRSSTGHMQPLLFTPTTGVLVFLVLLRWRRPEAWLLLSVAIVPQTWWWYNVLMLFTIPGSLPPASAYRAASPSR